MKKSMHFGLLITVLGLTSCNFPVTSDGNASDHSSSSSSSSSQTIVNDGYTITWVDWDGTVLEVDENVPFMSMPSYDGDIPVREDDFQYSYSFSNWSPNLTEVVNDTTYTAIYDKTEVIFAFRLNEDKNSYSLIKYNGDDEEVFIPSEHKGLPVTKIGEDAFKFNDSIVSVAIPDTIVSIENGAFSLCDSLTAVIFGSASQLVSIGSSAFFASPLLSSISIPSSVQTIGDDAFSCCNALTSIQIPDSVISIGESAFVETRIETIFIPDGVISIGNGAFGGVISNIVIYCEVPSKPVGWDEFWNNRYPVIWNSYKGIHGNQDGFDFVAYNGGESGSHMAITSYSGDSAEVVVPSTITVEGEDIPVTIIEENVFYDNDTIVSVTLPTGITSIGYEFFRGCSSLNYVSIPNGVVSIGDSAFYNCSSLRSISIPSSVSFIGEMAFWGCSSLATIIIDEDCKFAEIPSNLFRECSSLTSVCIPDSVTQISTSAFEGCDSLNAIHIPDSVKTISTYAFAFCDSLESVYIPSGVVSISEGAFLKCGSLTVYCEAPSQPETWDSLWKCARVVGLPRFRNRFRRSSIRGARRRGRREIRDHYRLCRNFPGGDHTVNRRSRWERCPRAVNS